MHAARAHQREASPLAYAWPALTSVTKVMNCMSCTRRGESGHTSHI